MADEQKSPYEQYLDDHAGWGLVPGQVYNNQPSAPVGETGALTLQDYLSSTVVGDYLNRDALPFYMELIDDEGHTAPLFDGDDSIFAVRFDINPTSMSINMAKIINRTQTMTAWVEDHWGDEIDTITLVGSTSSFVVGGRNLYGIRSGGIGSTGSMFNPQVGIGPTDFNTRKSPTEAFTSVDLENNTAPPDAVGLTVAYRRQSTSYRKLKRILQAMTSNGCQFGNSTIQAPGTTTAVQSDSLGLVTGRYYVRMSSDFIDAVGYIESFDLTEAAETPFRLQYTITFKSEKTEITYKG